MCVVPSEEINCREETNGIYILQYTQNPDALLHLINRMLTWWKMTDCLSDFDCSITLTLDITSLTTIGINTKDYRKTLLVR